MSWTLSDYPAPGIHWDLTEGEYRDAFSVYVNLRGYRLVDLCGYEVGGQARYAAIWQQSHLSPDSWVSDYRISFDEFQGKLDEWKGKNYRPVRINGYNVAGHTYFAAIWETARDLPLSREYHAVDFADLFHHVRSNPDLVGWKLVDVSGFTNAGSAQTLCATVWEAWPGYDDSWDWIQPQFATSYQGIFDGRDHVHYRATRNIGIPVQNSAGVEYTSVWTHSDGRPWTARYGLNAGALKTAVDQQKAAGLRLISLGGSSVGRSGVRTQQFCPIWEKREAGTVIPTLVDKFMRYFDVPGMSLAIAKNGQIVYTGGFGWADVSTGGYGSIEVPHNTRVTSASLFRIASLSKPITAMTIGKLLSENRISVQDAVFGRGGHLKELGIPADSRAEKITVRHLLEHSCGGWRNDNNDPMFNHPELNQRDLIRWVLANRPLDYSPGTKFLYSNFGYCVLGRIIEKVTGKPYEEYVQDNILAPCGVQHMSIAGNTKAQRQPGEVFYYDKNGADPYGIPVSRMDSHGGWLGSSLEVLEFVLHVDGFPTVPDIVDSDTLAYMTSPSGLFDDSTPPNPGNYAMGWNAKRVGGEGYRWWHTGNLPGTSAILVRTGDQFCWVAVMNTRRLEPKDKNPKDKDTVAGLDNLMWTIRDEVDHWL
ncbi:serine hydrolase [Streptomyces sp. NPDC007903]|uniref:serine hydrolase n=1 Tax=Streptomyces sp. NPDC007903 TaxID=3364786 RepID=UPI0036E82B44